MVHGYHVILAHYGFWLPNDPRGSWSDFVAAWEIARFGKTTRALEQRTLAHLTDDDRAALTYPPVTLTGLQAISLANGFAAIAAKSGYQIWACSILPEHTHLVIARHTYKCEQIANLLKGAATSRLIEDDRHPLAEHAEGGKRPPTMRARHQWIGTNGSCT